MIISDSTTLIVLFDLNRLDLLSNIFTRIIIPDAVYKEISVKSSIVLPSFIKVQQVKECEVLELLKNLLDLGESEAIALALELNLPLIIDEKKGRKIALREGIKIIGLLGIVYLNIKKETITQKEAKAFLDDAIAHGYRISTQLIDEMFDSL
jgi:predicted nucleic acid-binding protein